MTLFLQTLIFKAAVADLILVLNICLSLISAGWFSVVGEIEVRLLSASTSPPQEKGRDKTKNRNNQREKQNKNDYKIKFYEEIFNA